MDEGAVNVGTSVSGLALGVSTGQQMSLATVERIGA